MYATRPLTPLVCCLLAFTVGHPPTKRLHDDLLSDYNRLIRPVTNHSETLVINLSLKLTQLIEMVSTAV